MAVSYWYLVRTILLLFLLSQRSNSEPTRDKKALKAFLFQVPHSTRLHWNYSDSVCNWVGIGCDSSRTSVITLRLPAVGLVGPIPNNTIGRLSKLRVLSIHSNSLTGKLPSDFSNLTLLRSLYIGNNRFTGEFPPSLTRLTRLTRLDLSNNNFSGPIPFSINNLDQLTGLFLQGNNFSGQIPNINANLIDFNVSNNNLNGSIPKTLAKFPESSFVGNLQLCGGPLAPCTNSSSSSLPPPSPPPPPPIAAVPSTPSEIRHENNKKKLSKGAIIGISISAAMVFLILLLCLLKRLRKTNPPSKAAATAGRSVATGGEAAGFSTSGHTSGTGAEGGERNKLVLVDNGGGIYRFDLEDLLRASAEVLGKGSVGTSYKAVLEEGTTVVVKRLKEVVVGKEEFEALMEVLGKCKQHENVVALRAYYFSKDEKLLVYDYLPSGALSSLLHGSRGSGRSALDWDNRMKIALGTARGLAYLHGSTNLVHGNIKSSNILLRPNHDPAICDYGLTPLFSANSSSSSSSTTRIVGYRAPEAMDIRNPTFKSDVYSFGVLLLELLTGRSPNQASFGDEGIDLPRWVQSVVREEWTAEVFDVELMRYHNVEEEMVQLLQIAMACVSTVPDQRPSMQEVVRMIEDMTRSENATDDGIRQSSDDPSKGSDGHTPPMESWTPTSFITP